MKLYRYRPLNDFLFKELLYQEIYLATAPELNDPLDLDRQLNFHSADIDDIKQMVRFFLHQNLLCDLMLNDKQGNFIELVNRDNDDLVNFIHSKFCDRADDFVSLKSAIQLFTTFYDNENIQGFYPLALYQKLELLFARFLDNSAVACFSGTNTDFLMWSHYANSHTGICLEFELEGDKADKDICKVPLQMFSKKDVRYYSYEENVRRVNYTQSLSHVNFYEFLPVFQNDGNSDLMNLTKSWWHYYAFELRDLFCTKLSPWSTENEWRMVEISFQPSMPECRIRQIDFKCLTGVIFGAKTPPKTKDRIFNIFNEINHHPTYYQAVVDGSRGVVITPFKM